MENAFDLLAPWLMLAALLVPLVISERWIHQHVFGVGYLLSNKDEATATRLYYFFFLPGIFVHEFVQYLVAGALNVPIKQVIAWPEQQKNGTLRLDFIVVQRNKTDPIRAATVAAAPFLVMTALVYWLGTQQLRLDDFGQQLGTGDLETVGTALQTLLATPLFLWWVYFLFVIANSMLPKPEDAHGWPLILGLMGLISLAMLFIGLDEVLLETLAGPVRDALNQVNTALASVLGVNLVAIFLLGLLEDALESWKGYKMDYSGQGNLTRAADQKAGAAKKRVPGSDEPFPRGQPLPSIYATNLHIPEPPLATVPRPAATPAPATLSPAPAPAEPVSAGEAYRSRFEERRTEVQKRLAEQGSATEAPPNTFRTRPG
ncbi:MAG: hypothetical protein HC915_20255, partial [Anaerolineae bacterium]|nr:hypothetical protein [Anaerolineae bacterium]